MSRCSSNEHSAQVILLKKIKIINNCVRIYKDSVTLKNEINQSLQEITLGSVEFLIIGIININLLNNKNTMVLMNTKIIATQSMDIQVQMYCKILLLIYLLLSSVVN